jgi:hypothetical protein
MCNYIFSKILSFALLLLEFSSISSSVGNIGFLVIIFPFVLAPHTQYGSPGGQVHFPIESLNAFFTALSSNE